VVIDNDSSERCTVIDVFANDRTGLLYTIAAALRELELSVLMAKIGTHVDQALDVFYVTDRGGAKVEAEDRLDLIRSTLLARLERFERQGLTASRG
jgi:[protein-PII] uridylyltransferase